MLVVELFDDLGEDLDRLFHSRELTNNASAIETRPQQP